MSQNGVLVLTRHVGIRKKPTGEHNVLAIDETDSHAPLTSSVHPRASPSGTSRISSPDGRASIPNPIRVDPSPCYIDVYAVLRLSRLATIFPPVDSVDPALTERGEGEALKGAQELKKYGYTHFDLAFTSALQRAQKTLAIQLKEIGQEDLPTKRDQALNERSYGDLVGMNKAKAAEEFGAEQVSVGRILFHSHQIHRLLNRRSCLRCPIRCHRSTSGDDLTMCPRPTESLSR